jgi:hypothetical protein
MTMAARTNLRSLILCLKLWREPISVRRLKLRHSSISVKNLRLTSILFLMHSLILIPMRVVLSRPKNFRMHSEQ